MNYYIVQQWWVVPVIAEEPPMGDANRGSSQALGERGIFPMPERLEESAGVSSVGRPGHFSDQPSYHGQSYATPGIARTGNVHDLPTNAHSSFAGDLGQKDLETPLSMGTLASSLPNYRPLQSVPSIPNAQQSHPSASAQVQQHPHTHQHQQHPMPQAHQFIGQAGHNSGFNPQFVPPLRAGPQGGGGASPFLLHQSAHQARAGMTSPLQQGFPGQPFLQSQQPLSPQYVYYSPPYGNINIHQGLQGTQRQMDPNPYTAMGLNNPAARVGGLASAHAHGEVQPRRLANISDTGRRPNTPSTSGSIPAAPRGPPRKPKQSGHALWVGNLPPGAKITDLKDHFARDALNDIESVFLISKSNCAFVNYRTEVACAAAMNRFHESRFQGVRLVCRLRRATPAATPAAATSSGVPTGPAALSPKAPQSQTAVEAINHNREISLRAEESLRQVEGAAKINDKYFIVKSLTLEDLELSARNGIWATQSHNEAALNKAFETVENVYLIFSANKSGEYFGYARMVSTISEEAARDLDWRPRIEAINDDSDLPRAIPTPATETAPRGHILDDSARGTIFWESDPLGQEFPPASRLESMSQEESEDMKVSVDEGEQIPEVQAFGRPFKIEWVSTNRLPFYRTRGLRNPWNANRDVKIARDGTELETSIGRRLIEMFHRSAIQQPMVLGEPFPTAFQNLRPF